jgi:MFS family permease
MFAMQTLTTLATRPVIGMLSDRIGRRSVIVVGLTACSAAVWMMSAAESASLLMAAVFAYRGGCLLCVLHSRWRAADVKLSS